MYRDLLPRHYPAARAEEERLPDLEDKRIREATVVRLSMDTYMYIDMFS